MFLNRDPAYIYVHVMKTGGYALSHAFRPIAEMMVFRERVETLPWPGRTQLSVHSSAQSIRTAVGAEFWDQAATFGSVRNPWVLRLSMWFEMTKAEPNRSRMLGLFGDFRGWVRWTAEHAYDWMEATDEHAVLGGYLALSHRTQTAYLSNEEGKFLVKDVLHQETLGQDLARWCARVGVAHHPLRRLNVSRKSKHIIGAPSFEDFYDNETRDLVAQVYAEDFRRFGYDAEDFEAACRTSRGEAK